MIRSHSLEVFARELYHQLLARDCELKALNTRINSLNLIEAISLKKAWEATISYYYPKTFEQTHYDLPLNEEMVRNIKICACDKASAAAKYFSDFYQNTLRDHQNQAGAMNSRFAFRQRA